MQAIKLAQPGGLDNLTLTDVTPRDPGPGEIRVRNHASSLNFHDYAVVAGLIPVDDGLRDGQVDAAEVEVLSQLGKRRPEARVDERGTRRHGGRLCR